MTTIGVFDSGVGGLSVANAIKKAFPDIDVRFVNDHEHVPYGTKSNRELFSLAYPILHRMEADGCDVIVVACNTITTTIISELREKIKVPLIAVEPMVKPAASLTKSGTVAVCATPATLASKRYNQLKADYAKNVRVIEPDCRDWAALIENKAMDHDRISGMVRSVVQQGADVIVLGCTHYHWIEEDIKREAKNKAWVIQPEDAIVRHLRQTLTRLV
jgi:glutamate racemase